MNWFQRLLFKASGGARVLTSQQLAELLSGGSETNSGQIVTNDSAMRVISVYACVRLLATSVGMLPLNLYRRAGDSRVLVSDNPIANLLKYKPNSWQTAFEFKQMMQGHVALRGNAYARVIRVGREPRALIPMHPDACSVEQLTDGTLVYHGHGIDGSYLRLAQSDVFHLRGLTSSGLVGINPIAAAREGIGLAMGAEEHGARLFKNGAQIGGLLKHPARISDESGTKLRRQFEEKAAGVSNAHRTLLLEEGMDWVKVGMTNEDAQFLDTRKFQRTEIAALFQVPPHMIGDLERATFSNIEQQSLDFVRNSLEGWLECWEQAVKRDILWGLEGNRLEVDFDTSKITTGDLLSQMQAYQIAINTGVYNPNQVRQKLGDNPRDGGDDYRMTPNSVPEGTNNGQTVNNP